jgi:hypothetical protein
LQNALDRAVDRWNGAPRPALWKQTFGDANPIGEARDEGNGVISVTLPFLANLEFDEAESGEPPERLEDESAFGKLVQEASAAYKDIERAEEAALTDRLARARDLMGRIVDDKIHSAIRPRRWYEAGSAVQDFSPFPTAPSDEAMRFVGATWPPPPPEEGVRQAMDVEEDEEEEWDWHLGTPPSSGED